MDCSTVMPLYKYMYSLFTVQCISKDDIKGREKPDKNLFSLLFNRDQKNRQIVT